MKIKWWKYVLSIVVLIAADLLAPLLVYLLSSLFNVFTPKYLQSSEMWIGFLAAVLGGVFAISIACMIVDGAEKFSKALNYVYAVYSISIGIANYFLGTTQLHMMIAMVVRGIIIFAMVNKKKPSSNNL